MAIEKRDTDTDWRALGESQPHWAVLSHDDYRSENLTEERLQAFYDTGRVDIEHTVALLHEATGVRPSGAALDFGCGVGRLTEAMCDYAETVVGCDISPGMLRRACDRHGRARYVQGLPEGSFSWINSFIVLQHIPPERGMPILETLLGKLEPGGLLSVQLTVWLEPRNMQPAPRPGWRGVLDVMARRRWVQRLQPGVIFMYAYDLSAVVRLVNLAGITDMRMVSTDHDGHHGVIILGRKAAVA
jgi:SAM-dependent methyltransferase